MRPSYMQAQTSMLTSILSCTQKLDLVGPYLAPLTEASPTFADCLLLQVLTGILTFIVLHLENKVGYLRNGVKTLARAIHWQQAIDNYPVNDFGEL